jgi:hypothetical protein
MDDYASSDDDYQFSDQEDSDVELIENDDRNFQLLSSKAPSAQVFPFDLIFPISHYQTFHFFIYLFSNDFYMCFFCYRVGF